MHFKNKNWSETEIAEGKYSQYFLNQLKPISFRYIEFSTVRNRYYAIKMIQIDIYRNNTGLILYPKISNRNFSIFIILYRSFRYF